MPQTSLQDAKILKVSSTGFLNTVCLSGMSIVSVTICYPNPASPTQGVFVARRLEAIGRWMPVRVIAPRPWFPILHPTDCQTPIDSSRWPTCSASPFVVYPRMFYLPGIMKHWDARFFASAIESVIWRLNEEKPVRLIDAHFVWPDGVGAWLAARIFGLPFVCTIRGKLVSQIADRSKRRQIADMLRHADALIAVSGHLAKLANKVAGRNLDVHVIPNGIDPSLFHRTLGISPPHTKAKSPGGEMQRGSNDGPDPTLRDELGWTRDARYVLSVGHLQALKGFHHLVSIWPQVRRRIGDVRLVLVGGPAGEPAYQRRLTEQVDSHNADLLRSGLDETIHLVGRQSPQAVAKMLNAADLFVLASRSEGWCNAIAEALACGCPVVATDVGGNREIVTDSRVGQLVPFGNQHALIEALCEALSRTWDRGLIARIGSRRDWQQVGRQCVDVFHEVLRNRRRSGPAKRLFHNLVWHRRLAGGSGWLLKVSPFSITGQRPVPQF